MNCFCQLPFRAFYVYRLTVYLYFHASSNSDCIKAHTEHFVHLRYTIICYQTHASASPATACDRASLSERTPLDVDMIAMPKPLRTRGTSSAFAYTRNPGLLLRLIPEMTCSLFGPYFKNIRKIPCLLSSINS